MRCVIQRVNKAKVEINEVVVGEINKGLLILVGIENSDTYEDIKWLVNKIINLRIFNDENAKMNLSLYDVNGKVLVVSQFTLHASIKKGNRPSYINSANSEISIDIYDKFIKEFEKKLQRKIQTGVFGAYMNVSLENDGPVTIFIDTKNKY